VTSFDLFEPSQDIAQVFFDKRIASELLRQSRCLLHSDALSPLVCVGAECLTGLAVYKVLCDKRVGGHVVTANIVLTGAARLCRAASSDRR
jgi:hypothetical protein